LTELTNLKSSDSGQSELISNDSFRHGRNRKSTPASQKGYGTGAVLSERGIYLTSAIYRPVLEVRSILFLWKSSKNILIRWF
jgi:hypothetical protein